MIRQLTRKLTSVYFMGVLIEEYPILLQRIDYRRMMQYNLYGSFIDKNTGFTVIPCQLVAETEGKKWNRHYNAERFLKAFKTNVLPAFEWFYPDSREGRARMIKSRGLPPHIEYTFRAELRNEYNDSGKIYFDTGEVFSRKKQTADRKKLQQMALTMISHNDKATELLNYLNSLPVHLFSAQVNKYYPLALMKAQEIANEEKDDELYLQQSKLLLSIQYMVQPFYQPSQRGATDRIYPLNESMLMLRAPVRQALTADWLEFDIKSAHLAIFGYLWNVPEVIEFLKSGKSIWNEILDLYYLPYHQRLKKVFKDALYALCNGKAAHLVAGTITKYATMLNIGVYPDDITKKIKYSGEFKGDKFIRHPIIQALIAARDKAIAEIEVNGGAYTCFGRFMPMEQYPAKTIAAAQAQALELALIHPALELAKANKERFKITLWQHDGFSIYVYRDSEKEYWIGCIQEVVAQRAKELGIYTCLEVKA